MLYYWPYSFGCQLFRYIVCPPYGQPDWIWGADNHCRQTDNIKRVHPLQPHYYHVVIFKAFWFLFYIPIIFGNYFCRISVKFEKILVRASPVPSPDHWHVDLKWMNHVEICEPFLYQSLVVGTLNLFFRKHKTIFCIFHNFSILRWHSIWNFLPRMDNKDPFIIHRWYHCCWWPGYTRYQGIRNQSIDLVPQNIEVSAPAHWGQVMHIRDKIRDRELTIIGSDNGLAPDRCQAIIWTNAAILLTGPLGTNFSENLIEIHIFSFKKMHLKISSGKWQPFCLCLNVLKCQKDLKRSCQPIKMTFDKK